VASFARGEFKRSLLRYDPFLAADRDNAALQRNEDNIKVAIQFAFLPVATNE
jgi:hypothetical protein